ncbi:hypothetical protein [Thermoanaerobacterium sp. RBIITD]|uniref:hypothetical protein n=1 Tax=Thermoanaerobacterium sp. RBIITD TaxID=1550240 RepID=UPI000BB98AFF|nr:hypothetical protein [Thermoanaerobacterium sp. RBIITD]SNX53166.1 hypothetical protein SAMN05660242_0665 [Thermoanaerobacterium sp. RBIITD]
MIYQRAVYIFKFSGEKDFIGIAHDVQMYSGFFRLYATDRPRSIEGKVISEDEEGFVFTSSGYMEGEWQHIKSRKFVCLKTCMIKFQLIMTTNLLITHKENDKIRL